MASAPRCNEIGGSVAVTMKKDQRGVARRKTGMYPKSRKVQQLPEAKGRTLPEYLEAHEINALIATASNPKAKLLILLQWRAGLRVAEALAVTAADLMLESDSPTLRVRRGEGRQGPASSPSTPSSRTPFRSSWILATLASGASSTRIARPHGAG